MAVNLDEQLHNADWTKTSWGDLPPYKSKEFDEWLGFMKMRLADFRKLPVYKSAVKQGLIKDDKWVGRKRS